MGSFRDLPTSADVAADRVGKPVSKGKTRLEIRIQQAPRTKLDELTFRRVVWIRDRYRCRCCRRKVMKTLARIPERGEVNHLHGRIGKLRYEVRAALLLCLLCHERVTGRVNTPRIRIVASATFTTKQGTFTDATYPVTCRRAA